MATSPQALAQRLTDFLAVSRSSAYLEMPSELHTSISLKAWDQLKSKIGLGAGAKVLDVGCGCGHAMDMFGREGYDVTGLTCLPLEFDVVEKRHPGKVLLLDMHEIGTLERKWDLIWARHVVEHSPAPAFVLSEFRACLNPGGFLYLEVPGAETDSRHETNPDHKSVLGRRMWEALLAKTKFTLLPDGVTNVKFRTKLGMDEYYGWLVQKPAE